MMMTQQHYGGEYDAFHRGYQRAPSAAGSAGYYSSGRHVPYANYEHPRAEYRMEPGIPVGTRVINLAVNEPGEEPQQPRRRTGVACTRCRRRKIKCSGKGTDGDDSCQACRQAGQDSECNFYRVNSSEMAFGATGGNSPVSTGGLTNPSTVAPFTRGSSPPSFEAGYASAGNTANTTYRQVQNRPSLPMLQTRVGYHEYDPNPYDTSPANDVYNYASPAIARSDGHQLPTVYNNEGGFRTWTSGSGGLPISVTSTGAYYETGAPFSFGSLQTAPGYGAQTGARLPSVTGDMLSPLNMSSMHTSLPAQTVQERRLPTPYSQGQAYQPSYTNTDVPQIRPLTGYVEATPRDYLPGTHGMAWPIEPSMPGPIHGSGSIGNLSMSDMHSLPILPSSRRSTAAMAGEAAQAGFYPYTTVTYGQEMVPTAGPSAVDDSQSSSSSGSSTVTANSVLSSAAATPGINQTEGRYLRGNPASSSGTGGGLPRVTSQQDAKASVSASTSEPRRRKSRENQRESTASRMSVSNLNGRGG